MRFVYRCAYILLAAILGPAACEVLGAKYGPLATYSLDGVVVAAPSSEPIRGISVDFHGNSVLTGAEGKWRINGTVVGCADADFLEVRDIDGEENGGLFADETVPLDPISTGRCGWEQHDIRVDLEPAG